MIKKLYIDGFRNYHQTEIIIDQKINLFIGKNGHGKTNLLEALFFIGMLRSFRTLQIRDLKSIGSRGFIIAAEIDRIGGWKEHLEINYIDNKRNLKIDDKSIFKSSEFIKKIKPVVFSPDDINIVNGNSMNRRRFMDFFISLLEPNYLSALQCYSIALKSRNIILKNQLVDVDMLKAYEVILAEFGTIISNFRKKYSQILTDSIKKLLLNFYGSTTEFKIKYHPIAPCFDEESFMERFQQERERDLKRGFSSFGPQVDEFYFFLDQKMMRNFASNGQCRLISLCLKMASVEIISQNNDKNDIVVLVDDVTGDLDPVVKETFFKTIDCAGQSFFTFTEIPDEKYFDNRMVYKINDGVIS